MTNPSSYKRLTYEQFRKMALSDRPEALRNLPKDLMPEDVPRSLIQEVDYQHRPMIENLIFEISSHRLNVMMSLSKDLGQAVQDAVTLSKASYDSEEFILFKKMSGELAHAYVRSKGEKKHVPSDRFKEEFSNIKPALLELRRRMGDNLQARQILTEACEKARPQYVSVLKQAIDMLDDNRATIDKAIGAFFFVCLSITAQHMNRNRTHIEKSEAHADKMYAAIEVRRESLKDLCSNYIKKKMNAAQVNKLKADIIQIEERIKQLEIIISEEDLLMWLDVLVEVSLNGESARKSDSLIRSARLSLFYLLNKYCFIQEEGARQIAKTPFVRSDPKKAIQFMLSSEAFILRYFSEKRLEMSSWLGGSATSRIEDIGVLEQDLISQMKKSAKKLG